jgi:hypothetical protein
MEFADYLRIAVELNHIAKQVCTALPYFIDRLIQLAQIPNGMEYVKSDQKEFIFEVTGETEAHILRAQVSEIFVIIRKFYPYDLLDLVWNRVQHLVRLHSSVDGIFNPYSWKLLESSMFILTRLLAEGYHNAANVNPKFVEQLINFISECQLDHQPPLLKSRAFLSAASVCRSFSSVIDTNKIKIPLFEAALTNALTDSSDTVRISCIMAIHKYCFELSHDHFLHFENKLYQVVELISDKVQTSASFTIAELLFSIAQCDLARAARSPRFLNLLYIMVYKDMGNVMLTNEVLDLIAEIGEVAIDEGVYPQFLDNCLNPITSNVVNAGVSKSAAAVKSNPELIFALNVLSVSIGIQNQPIPAANKIKATFFAPVCYIALESIDEQVLELSTEILASIVSNSPTCFILTKDGGRNDIDMLIRIVDHLLSAEICCGNIGLLVLAIIRNFGSVMGESLMPMITANVEKLVTTDSSKLIESLLSVFIKLIDSSPRGVVSALSNIEVRGESGLKRVLSKWLTNFDAFHSYADIQKRFVLN